MSITLIIAGLRERIEQLEAENAKLRSQTAKPGGPAVTTDELHRLLSESDHDEWTAVLGSSPDELAHTITSGKRFIIISHVFGPNDRANIQLMALAPRLATEVIQLRGALKTAADLTDRLQQRQQELLQTIAKMSREMPYADEVTGWETQRRAMIAEVGTLRARVAELEENQPPSARSDKAVDSQTAPGWRLFSSAETLTCKHCSQQWCGPIPPICTGMLSHVRCEP